MTELPLWAVYVVTFGTPLSAFLGVLISQLLSRRTAKETDTRSKREELMRNLRWAAELAAAEDERKRELGVAQLTALGESDLLDAGDQGFIDAALASVIREPAEEIDEIEAAGDAAEVVEVVEVVEEIHDDLVLTDDVTAVLSSEPDEDDEEASGEQG